MSENKIVMKIKDIPIKLPNETLIDYSEMLANWYVERTTPEYRKKRGQFFTPGIISSFMIRRFEDIDKKNKIKILDPGAGVGIFESAFCEYLLSLNKKTKVLFTLYENDRNLLFLLEKNMEVCKAVMNDLGYDISYRIISEDFVLSNASIYKKTRNNNYHTTNRYDLILSNPPYYKLHKNFPQAVEIRNIFNSHLNMYTIFMALSAKLLKHNGQMTIITPRSYCSGYYFKRFRKWFFSTVKPLKIHIFNSREDVFKRYNVLQEIIILTAIKSQAIPRKILVSISNGIVNKYEELKTIHTTYDKIIIKREDDLIMRVPTSELDDLVATQIDKYDNNLNTPYFRVSTGPVVPFRVRDYLLDEKIMEHRHAPLIWMHNIVNEKIVWPNKMYNKPIAIEINKKTKKLLVPKGNYVLIKRFSTKEGKKRISAAVLLEKSLNADQIGIENHVNYIYKVNGKLTKNEVYGIVALLNSKIYNLYFQMENGSTQVNATEINNLPLPSIEKIRKIGSLVIKEKGNNEIRIEKLVAKQLNIENKIINELIGEI